MEKQLTYKCKTCEKSYYYDIQGECAMCRRQKSRATYEQMKTEEEKRKERREALDSFFRHIPPLYQKASIGDLPVALKDTILNLKPSRGIFLWGGPGVGKTHAMAAIANYITQNGTCIRRVKYESLCLEIRSTFRNDAQETEENVLRKYTIAPVLIIEDIGTTVGIGSQESDFSLRTLYMILDDRLEMMKPTFITTNKSVEELEKSFDARIASRIIQACEIYHLDGKDRRKV